MSTPTLEKPTTRGRRRWTIGQVATDLGIILVAVPSVLNWVQPPIRSPYGTTCGDTPENNAFALGLTILGVRTSWLALKWLNDAFERRLALSSTSRYQPKPQPLDDF